MDYPLSRAAELDLHNGKFDDGVPGVRPASVIPSESMNALFDELLAVQAAAGLDDDEGSLTQVRDAIRILIRRGAFSVAAGTADAMTVALTPAATVLTDGMEVRVRCVGSNTSVTPTLKLDALPAKTIVGPAGGALETASYVANWPAVFRYRESTDKFEFLNPIRRVRQQRLTASGFFTVPPGVTSGFLTLASAGAGGGGGAASATGGGGGGGATAYRVPVSLTPGDVIPVTIGLGGIGGNAGAGGTSGGSSSFGSLLTVAASSAGTGASGSTHGLGGSGGPAATNVVAGGPGEWGGYGGGGGGSLLGTGGNIQAGAAGSKGGGYGVGGSGGAQSQPGGNGTDGFCLVEW